MGVNSLPKTVTRQRRDRDLNPDPSAFESSTLTTRLPSQWSHPVVVSTIIIIIIIITAASGLARRCGAGLR